MTVPSTRNRKLTNMQIRNGQFLLGDCLEIMPTLEPGSVDMVLCDLPYGTTACAWDSVIPFEPLWREIWRLTKQRSAVVLTASQPFTSALVMSAPRQFRDEWIWAKNAGTNFANAARQPLREHESVIVFCQNGTYYNPIRRPRLNERARKAKKAPNHSSTTKSEHRFGTKRQVKQYDPNTRFPGTVLPFDVVPNAGGRKMHPTQKPVALFEYLIRTYSEPGAVVLDMTAGSGTTAIAAERAGRRWLCIERDEDYYWQAVARVLGGDE